MRNIFTDYTFILRSVVYLIAFFYAVRKHYYEISTAVILFSLGGYCNFILDRQLTGSMLITAGAVLLVFHVINLDKKEKRHR